MVDQYVGPAETLHDEIEKLLRSVFLCHVRSKNGMIAAQFRRQHLESVLSPCDKDELRACRSEEHTSELQSLMRISYAVFCLNKQNINVQHKRHIRPQCII